MTYHFPPDFAFGTSTCAYQIETAFEHDWTKLVSRDGNVFERTTDHEKRIDEDVTIIASLAPNYRMSLMWSKLQRTPLGDFEPDAVEEYTRLLKLLESKQVNVMMVLHHFANPNWFAKNGGWENPGNIHVWLDYAKKLVDTFGHNIRYWNTFNEPNVYATMGWLLGEFPPFRTNFFTARNVIRNLAAAHGEIYHYIKARNPNALVGISHNCIVARPQNLLGVVPAKLFDKWFMEYAVAQFEPVDFHGLSYYAKICFDPFPITTISAPEKIKRFAKPHDDMWEYYPEGLKENIQRFWKKSKKPIIITENGLCTKDDKFRINAIKDYMRQIKECIESGIDVRGYYHWSPWDNFEWTLGPTYRFGLFECDLKTKERRKKESADVYSRLAYSRQIDLS